MATYCMVIIPLPRAEKEEVASGACRLPIIELAKLAVRVQDVARQSGADNGKIRHFVVQCVAI